MSQILHYLSLSIGTFSLVIIAWGAFRGAFLFLKLELEQIFGKKSIYHQRENLRQNFGSYILLGLEFLVAADIVGTIAEPNSSLRDIAILASTVGIRIVLGFFLNLELDGIDCED